MTSIHFKLVDLVGFGGSGDGCVDLCYLLKKYGVSGKSGPNSSFFLC